MLEEDICPNCGRVTSPGELEEFNGLCCVCDEIDREEQRLLDQEEAPEDG
jgi:hypothetical protein